MLRDFENDIVIRAAVLKEGGDYVLSPVVATCKSKAIAFKELKYYLCNYGDKWAAIRPNEDL